jgi:hypothetical protein
VLGIPQPYSGSRPSGADGLPAPGIPERVGEVTTAAGDRRSRFAPASAGLAAPGKAVMGGHSLAEAIGEGRGPAVPSDAVPEETAATGPKHDGAALRAGRFVERSCAARACGDSRGLRTWLRLTDEAPPWVGLGITMTSTCCPSTLDA